MRIVVLVALPEELPPRPDVVYTGVGKVNAALAAARVIASRSPDLVVNYGSAGGVTTPPGQLVEVATVLQRDADCEPLAPRGMLLGDVAELSSGYPGVRCGSGDSFVRSTDDWLRSHYDVVDMELWGIAKACAAAKVPWRALKWISDGADADAAAHWQENHARGAHAFLDRLARL